MTAYFERGPMHGSVARFHAPGAPKRVRYDGEGTAVIVDAEERRDGATYYNLAKFEQEDKAAFYIEDGGAVCDFCSGPDPVWDYPCEDFVVDFPDDKEAFQSLDEGFTACAKCGELIEAGDRRGLLDRSVAVFEEHHVFQSPDPTFSYGLRRDFRKIQDEFFARRTGPRKPLDENTNPWRDES